MKIRTETIYRRLFITLWIALYIGLFVFIYITWGSDNYFYLGLKYHSDLFNIVIAILVCLFSSYILPQSITKYSHFFSWFVYLMTFVPSILIIWMQNYTSFNPIYLSIALTISFFFIVKIPEVVKLLSIKQIKLVDIKKFYVIFLIIYMILNAFYLYFFYEVLSLSGLEEVYDQRERFGSFRVIGLAGYLSGWLATAMNPYLISVGLFDKQRRWMLPIGIAGQVLVYMGFAGKIMLASVVIMVASKIFRCLED